MLLADKILKSSELSDFTKGFVRHSTTIKAQNVADYWAMGTDQCEWKLHRDFPCVRPPIQRLFFEWRSPNMFRNTTGLKRVKSDHWENGTYSWMSSYRRAGVFMGTTDLLREAWVDAPGLPENGVVGVNCVFFVQNTDITVQLPWSMHMAVDYDGKIVWPLDGLMAASKCPDFWDIPTLSDEMKTKHWDEDRWRAWLSLCRHLANVPLLAINFMHCKNVQLIPNEVPEKLKRKRIKKHGNPGLKYYTLEISSMRRVLETEGNISKNGLKKALHICRGHFKDYRESGLFGKIKGVFWWDANVRGDIKQGAVIKDYAVKP